MLRIFRRLWGPARNPPETSGRARASEPSALPVVSEPIPVPEVVEGNGGESDWNLWQNSVLTLEGESQQPAPPSNGYEETQPLSAEEIKGFVKKRSSSGAA